FRSTRCGTPASATGPGSATPTATPSFSTTATSRTGRPDALAAPRVARASGRSAEVDLLGLDRPGCPPRRRLVGPVQVRVRDDLVRRRRTPCRLVLRRVGVADQRREIGRAHV